MPVSDFLPMPDPFEWEEDETPEEREDRILEALAYDLGQTSTVEDFIRLADE